MATTVGVIQFPGSNCEFDIVEAFGRLGARGELIFHRDTSLGDVDAVVIPGGFAHGDYLRPGAIARFSPIMEAIGEFASAGGPVIGVCNGFQILTEAGLLPGALQKNRDLKFICDTVDIRVEQNTSALTRDANVGDVLAIPINHFEGNYTASPETIKMLNDEGRVVVRYVENPNGSMDDIAGICNAEGNVVGLMPHPERASDPLLGSSDGLVLLSSVLTSAGAKLPA